MAQRSSRREFIRRLGLSAATAPFICNLPSLAFANTQARKQRLVLMFTPNGVEVPKFWPDQIGEQFSLSESLSPLEPFKSQTLILRGIDDQIIGYGDEHQRGISTVLTAIEMLPGNTGVAENDDIPAGWAGGISIDQEIKNFLQRAPETHTRFGSLELGVMVPNRHDNWHRWVYADRNKPLTPITDPYQVFDKLYGRRRDESTLTSVLDAIVEDLNVVRSRLSNEDRRILDEQLTFTRDLERELADSRVTDRKYVVPTLPPDVKNEMPNFPSITKMQVELLVSSFLNDFARVATIQFNNSAGDAHMTWLGIEGVHHNLSHAPYTDIAAHDDLAKIDKWYCEQLAYLAKRLAETPEPGGPGSMLDNTLILWTNELGDGNKHSLTDLPFILVGGGLNLKMGRSLQYQNVPHNRLLMALAHGFGHHIEHFGKRELCSNGTLSGLT